MWWDGRDMRTFRCRLLQVRGTLGQLHSGVGDRQGLNGEIRAIRIGSRHVVCDITIYADDPTTISTDPAERTARRSPAV